MSRDAALFLHHGNNLDSLIECSVGSFLQTSKVQLVVIATTNVEYLKKQKIVHDLSAKCDLTILPIPNTDGAELGDKYGDWNTQTFNLVSNKKFELLEALLNSGFSKVYYFDLDIYFFRDPLPFLSSVLERKSYAFQSECQSTFPQEVCTGVMAFRNDFQSRVLLRDIQKFRSDAIVSANDQVRINWLLASDPLLMDNVFVLPETIFLNGISARILLADDQFDGAVGTLRPILAHANWLVGIENKLKFINLVRKKRL